MKEKTLNKLKLKNWPTWHNLKEHNLPQFSRTTSKITFSSFTITTLFGISYLLSFKTVIIPRKLVKLFLHRQSYYTERTDFKNFAPVSQSVSIKTTDSIDYAYDVIFEQTHHLLDRRCRTEAILATK